MTEDPEQRPARHMGSIVDPVAEATDWVPPEPEAPDVPPRLFRVDTVGGNPSDTSTFQGSGSLAALRGAHPVRDRLLAKAQAAAEVREPAESASTLGFSSLKDAERELEQIALPERTTPFGSLSPAAVLTTGTLIGAAAIATLFALLVQLAPRGAQLPAATKTDGPVAAPSSQEINIEPGELRTAPPKAGPWRVLQATTGQRFVKGTVGRAAFLNALQSAGLTKGQAYEIFNALKGVADLDHCRPSSEFRVLVDARDGSVSAVEYIVSKEEVYQARASAGGLVGKALDLKVEKRRVEGAISMTGETFAAALSGTPFDASLARVINKALDGHTGVEQFHVGDRLRVIAQEVSVLGEFARYTGIEALEYVPIHGSAIRVYYSNAKRKYYDAKGRAPGEGWRKPVKGAPITSKFNPNRLHPILKKRMPHQGTDFGAPTGTPIHASRYGVIDKLGPLGPNGNFIGITHAGGYETGYSHLSRFEPGLKVGDKVESLQVIGYVGSTGRSTGPHLHFSAKKDGVFIDAESLHLDALAVLPLSDRAAFDEVRRSYDRLLDAIALPVAAPTPAPALASATPEVDSDGEFAPDNPPEPSPAPPSGGAVAPAAVVVPAAGQKGSVYLSDKELIQSQSAQDDGEVAE